ncbi:dehydrodolichyl diphosphate synthase 2-like [Olea europaea subsp. europaea]|uniref:Alkyl transferase n=1 Tax=Olea europaea subsp. europaea TaxID=158383 RepID=A0A8S0RPH7_OLEEU|nr:dehydrodolichyl diphosphate synthase 2-like [Olea europaea subsp. europaea]
MCCSESIAGDGRRETFFANELSLVKAVQIQETLPRGLKPELLPNHIAIILDGNRRWANEKGFKELLPNHRNGGRVIKEIVFLCCKWRIKVVSIFAFWFDPNAIFEQVDALMCLFEEVMQNDLEEFMGYNVQISFIGDKSKLPKSLQELIATVENSTRGNMGLHLMIAINYGGRYDVMQASRSIASKVKDGSLQVEDINETLFEKELETNCAEFPNPDLLIRTSGEQRISNFYLWQLANTEVFFSVKKLLDFEEEDFIEALISFQKRERRYGGN